MKALIFNSGVGNRMGDFTANNHKSMARLSDGETIFGRQLRLLELAGLRDVVVTTGPYEDQLREVVSQFPNLAVTFVRNPVFDRTNYIYSMHLAAPYLDDDVVLMHGDLVFDLDVLNKVLSDPRPNLGAVNESIPQPEKDFKARVKDGVITEVSVSINDPDCVAFQPLYKLDRDTIGLWLRQVSSFVESGDVQVYAENALNTVAAEAGIEGFSYDQHFVNEIDTLEDLETHSRQLRLWDARQQKIIAGSGATQRTPELLDALGVQRPLIVGGTSFKDSALRDALDKAGTDYSLFSGYSPNPKVEEVMEGLAQFRAGGCDAIISMGGGSPIDVAKCIKLLASAESWELPSSGAPIVRNVPHLCVPTTAGTGSESTHFSVVYIDGQKNSVAHDAMLPDVAILDPDTLRTLPLRHRESSYLDALTQCIESVWAKSATEESRAYAVAGIRMLLDNHDAYLVSDDSFDVDAAAAVQAGANYSGRAINLSKTTAAHAMSYGITARYGLPHGAAAALSLCAIWDHCNRAAAASEQGLRDSIDQIATAFGVGSPERALDRFREIVNATGVAADVKASSDDLDELVGTVNAERLGNHPMKLSKQDLHAAYSMALNLNA